VVATVEALGGVSEGIEAEVVELLCDEERSLDLVGCMMVIYTQFDGVGCLP
jgi:hypothetical protein